MLAGQGRRVRYKLILSFRGARHPLAQRRLCSRLSSRATSLDNIAPRDLCAGVSSEAGALFRMRGPFAASVMPRDSSVQVSSVFLRRRANRRTPEAYADADGDWAIQALSGALRRWFRVRWRLPMQSALSSTHDSPAVGLEMPGELPAHAVNATSRPVTAVALVRADNAEIAPLTGGRCFAGVERAVGRFVCNSVSRLRAGGTCGRLGAEPCAGVDGLRGGRGKRVVGGPCETGREPIEA